MSKVELYERIRREYRVEGTSIHELARRHGVHRRTVREALACATRDRGRRPNGPRRCWVSMRRSSAGGWARIWRFARSSGTQLGGCGRPVNCPGFVGG
jgi:transposase-like protein